MTMDHVQGKEVSAEPFDGGAGGTPVMRSSHSRSGQRSSSRPHSRSSRSNHSHRPSLSRRLSRRERSLLGVLLVLPWLLLLGLACWQVISANRQRTRQQQERAALQKAEETTREWQEKAEQLNGELAALVEGRLQGDLRALDFDQVIPVEDGLLKNVLFTQIRKDKQHIYEYKLVVENKRSGRIQPRVRILLFDRLGIQIGTADISQSTDWGNLPTDGLGAGESQSFSGSIDLQLQRQPRYFMLTEGSPAASGA